MRKKRNGYNIIYTFTDKYVAAVAETTCNNFCSQKPILDLSVYSM